MEAPTEQALNVLLAVHHFPPRFRAGAELMAYRTAQWLVQRGHRVEVVCIESIDDVRQDAQLSSIDDVYEGIPVRRLSFNLAATPDPLRWSFDNPLIEAEFDKVITRGRPDLLHLFSGYLLGIAPLRAARRAGLARVVRLSDFWFLCPTLQLLRGDGSLCFGPETLDCLRCMRDTKRRYRFLDQRVPSFVRSFWHIASEHPALGTRLRVPQQMTILADREQRLKEELNAVDAILCPTRYVADIHVANGIDADRITVVPVSVSANESPPHHVDGKVHFGYLGQLAPVKGVDILVRAFRKLERTHRKAHLTIYGSLDAQPNYARRLRRLAGGDAEIEFAGGYRHENVLKILGGMDCLIVPSRWHENSPIVILEAFSAGRPVIGTNVGGISEIVRDGVNGLLFARDDPSALAGQLQRVLDEPELLGQLKRNIPHIRTPEEEMGQLFGVYVRALSTRRSGASIQRC